VRIPENYTEEEVVVIIQRIAGKLANKFKFGYHEMDDMKQQGALFAWEGIAKYDNVRPLENFLWVHVRNQLFNFKRNNFARPDKPCDDCPLKAYTNLQCTAFTNMNDCEAYDRWESRNQSKKSLMSTKEELKGAFDDTSAVEDRVFAGELFRIVNSNIHYSLREDWIRFTNKLKLNKKRREELMAAILIILQEHNIKLPGEFIDQFGGEDG